VQEGALYRHMQIKDARYRIEKVDKSAERVYLRNTNGRGEGLWVTFVQLKSSYRKV
jgi:hypothetical protein